MKKQTLIFAIAFFGTSSFLFAQGLRLGVEAGPSFTNFVGQQGKSVTSVGLTWDGYQIDTGFTGGLFVDWFLFNNFSIEPEVSFVQKGSNPQSTINNSSVNDTSSSVYSLNYLEFSLFPMYHFPLLGFTANVFGGPSIGFLLSNQIHFFDSQNSINVTLNNYTGINNLDYGLNLGCGVELGHFLLNLKYQLGLANIENPNPGSGGLLPVQNQMLTLTAGYYI